MFTQTVMIQNMCKKTIHIKKKKKICSTNLLTYDKLLNFFFISFTMQKYFEIALIRVQLPKYYHVAYNIISVAICVSVNNNKR